jgi:hypothetical protein
MARGKSKLNQASEEVIEANILKENPLGLPDAKSGLVIATEVPKTRRIQFVNGRDPGITLEFHYATGTHPLHHYKLHHGAEYDLPIEVIEHLENCSENQYAYRKNFKGDIEMYVKSVKYIFQCKNVKQAA